MKTKEKKQTNQGPPLPQPSSSDLRGHQSVRATFRLSERAIEALSIVSLHLGVKQKSLFDHLIEDGEVLNRLAGELQSMEFDLPDRIQKTFVLNKRTLLSLERVSKAFETSRDALVEYSVKRLFPLIAEERERHEKRKDTLEAMGDYVRAGERMLDKARQTLGEDDPVYEKMEEAMKALKTAHGFADAFVEKGKIIEEF